MCECTWSFCEMQNESKTSPGIKVIICMHTFKFKRCCRAVKIASCQADETDIFTFCCACTKTTHSAFKPLMLVVMRICSQKHQWPFRTGTMSYTTIRKAGFWHVCTEEFWASNVGNGGKTAVMRPGFLYTRGMREPAQYPEGKVLAARCRQDYVR